MDTKTDDGIIELGLSAFLEESRDGETTFITSLTINKMSNNVKAILGAVVSAVIVAVLGYLLSVGDVWKLDFHSIVNIAVMAFAGSLLKYVGTSNGNFLGVIPTPITFPPTTSPTTGTV